MLCLMAMSCMADTPSRGHSLWCWSSKGKDSLRIVFLKQHNTALAQLLITYGHSRIFIFRPGSFARCVTVPGLTCVLTDSSSRSLQVDRLSLHARQMIASRPLHI